MPSLLKHAGHLIIPPCCGGHSTLAKDLIRTQSKLIASFPLAAYCCDVDDIVVCYNQACLKFWGHDLGSYDSEIVHPTDVLLEADGEQLAADHLPSSIALMKEPSADGLEILIKQAEHRYQRALIYARLAHNETGDMVGVVCALIDPENQFQVEAANKAATRPPDEFMDVLAHEARHPPPRFSKR